MSATPNELIERLFTKFRVESTLGNGDHFTEKPSLTIARDPGSGGKPIAELVAKKLGFDFYDDQLVEAVAKSVKKRKKIISQVDERTRSSIEDFVHGLFNPEYVSDTTYVNHLCRVILSLIHKGNVVILGRGANFIAPKNTSLNVLVTAPREVCIERAIKYEKVSKGKAIKIINKITAERKDFVSQYFNKDYANPKYYDLIVNTEYMDIESASNLIISAFRKKFPNFTERAKQTFLKTTRLY